MHVVLSDETQKRLLNAALRNGIGPEEMARQLIEQHLPETDSTQSNKTTLDLLEQWEREDQTDDPEEIARRQRQGDELMKGLARNRVEMEGPNARKLWP